MHAGDRMGVAIDCVFFVTWVELGSVQPQVAGTRCTWRQWCRMKRHIAEQLWHMPSHGQHTFVSRDQNAPFFVP
jgi:hypothetical protein